MAENNSSSGGIGFGGGLLLLFIALKLLGKIDWSWWWVLSPMWIPTIIIAGIAAIYFGVIGAVCLVGITADKVKRIQREKQRRRLSAKE